MLLGTDFVSSRRVAESSKSVRPYRVHPSLKSNIKKEIFNLRVYLVF